MERDLWTVMGEATQLHQVLLKLVREVLDSGNFPQ